MRKQCVIFIMAVAMLLPILSGAIPASAQNSETITADTVFTVRTSMSAGGLPVLWALTRDGNAAELSEYIIGMLTDSGGSISFRQSGAYTLTASVTDATGRVFSSTRNVTVMPKLNCDFSISTTNTHIKNSISVTMDAASNSGGKTIVWSLTKSGSNVSYTGALNNSGGSLKATATGSYTLTASITDSGTTVTCSKNFTIYNNAPNTPVITRSPNDSVVNSNDQIRITATATDPDGDSVNLVWENRASEYAKYAVGSHTIRVKAVDAYGAESGWASVSFTSALLSECGTFTSNSRRYVYAQSSRVFASARMAIPEFNKRGGYYYRAYIEFFDNATQQTVQKDCDPYADGTTFSSSLNSSFPSTVVFGFETNDPQLGLDIEFRAIYQ